MLRIRPRKAMTVSRLRSLFLIASFAFFCVSAQGAKTAAAATTPAATETTPDAQTTPAAQSAPAATIADTLTQAIASEDFQRMALARLERLEKWQELSRRLTALEDDFDKLAAGVLRNPESVNSIELDRYLRELHFEADAIVDDIAVIVRGLEQDGSLLETTERAWQERTAFLERQAVPAEVLERTRLIRTKLQQVSVRVRVYRDKALLALNHAVSLQTRIGDARALIAARQAHLDAVRMTLERAPIWRLGDVAEQAGQVVAELSSIWQLQRHYFVNHGARLAGIFFCIFAVSGWLFTRRAGVSEQSAQCGFGRPFTAALLVALVSLGWLAPNPPRLFFEALFLLAPVPAAMVALRATNAPIALTLYGIACSTILFSLRGLLEASPVANRLIILLQAIVVAVPIAIDLRHGHLQQALRWVRPGTVRAAASIVIAVSVLAGVQAIFGFLPQASFMRSGLGSVLDSGVVFVTTGVLLYGAARALLATPLGQWFNSARTEDPALLTALRLTIGALTVFSILVVSMGSLGLIFAANTAVDSLMQATVEVGSLSIAFKSVALAIAIVVVTFVLTGIVGFILSREIVPRLPLRSGSGYAIVTFTRWAMIILGAVFALSALGIDMAKITLLAGALSVGIGFGLQNVVNNFVSGLILIVERPINIGDVIEWGGMSGTVTRIGIRSSTVRTGQGAEILVPNGDLVSKEVVNWTRSDRRRRYDVDVGVGLDSNPEEVMALLMAAAAEVREIMQNPPPRVVFKGVSDTAMTFTLLAWVSTVDIGMQAQNAVRVAMIKKLEGAGIAPFSSRPVDIQPAEDQAPKV